MSGTFSYNKLIKSKLKRKIELILRLLAKKSRDE